MPSGLDFAHPSMSGELSDRSDLGAGFAQAQCSLREDAEVDQTPAASARLRVSCGT